MTRSLREWHWLSSHSMTVAVQTLDGVIVNGAPIVRSFRGQPLDDLRRWMRRQGGFRERQLQT